MRTEGAMQPGEGINLRARAGQASNRVPSAFHYAIRVSGPNFAEKHAELWRAGVLDTLVALRRLQRRSDQNMATELHLQTVCSVRVSATRLYD